MTNKNSLGCGKSFFLNSSIGFICGVANAWGEEKFCLNCKLKLKENWKKEDKLIFNKKNIYFVGYSQKLKQKLNEDKKYGK